MTAARRSGTRSPLLFPLRRVAKRGGRPTDLEDILPGLEWLPPYDVEFQFCARRWRFDYAWPLWKIALEQEGGAHGRLIVITAGHERRKGRDVPLTPGTRIRVGGRHQTGPGMELDVEKYNTAQILGWLVLRGTTRQIRDGDTIRDLRAAFVARGLE